MQKHFILVAVITCFLAIDIAWITLNKNEYGYMVERVQKDVFVINKYAGVIAYLLMIIAYIFLIIPLLETKRESLNEASFIRLIVLAIRYGGIYGLTAYGIFNFTNMSLFKHYPLSTGIKDTIWGTFVYSLISFVTLLLMKYKLV